MNKSCLIGFLMCSAFSLVVQAATDGAHITKTISQIERKKGIKPVSYTHLTLPTSDLV